MFTVASYNIRYDNKYDGDWSWEFREPFILNQIKTMCWDILAIQEALENQFQALNAISVYDSLSFYRGDEKNREEYNPILYKKDRFILLDSCRYWISENRKESSFYKGAGCKRIISIGIFKDKDTGNKLQIINTHLDNVSEEARVYGAKMILDICDNDIPTIVMGDFNSTREDKAFKMLHESFSEIKDDLDPDSRGTYIKDGGFLYKDEKESFKEIDFIFYKGLRLIDSKRIFQSHECRLFSDHLAIEASFEFIEE